MRDKNKDSQSKTASPSEERRKRELSSLFLWVHSNRPPFFALKKRNSVPRNQKPAYILYLHLVFLIFFFVPELGLGLAHISVSQIRPIKPPPVGCCGVACPPFVRACKCKRIPGLIGAGGVLRITRGWVAAGAISVLLSFSPFVLPFFFFSLFVSLT
jgi:hypothetical protein